MFAEELWTACLLQAEKSPAMLTVGPQRVFLRIYLAFDLGLALAMPPFLSCNAW